MSTSTNGGAGKQDSGASVASPAETVHSHELSSESVAGTTAVKGKICCVCGKDVAHEERFKDKKGRYWCYECGVEDSHRRHNNDLVKCPDCQGEFPEKDLVEYHGYHLCAGCIHKREVMAKREAARKAAAEEAERLAERKWQRMKIGAISFCLVAVAMAMWLLLG